jgi:hypothetical protein
MARIFILAPEEVKKECLRRAEKWHSEPNQKMFVTGKHAFILAVAEFLANEKGLTLYECNATYPKGKEDV